MSTRPQKQISCKKHASVDTGARVSTLGEAVMASVPYGVPAAALCRGIVRHSAKGTIRKDSATSLTNLSAAGALRFYAPISPSFPVLPHLDKRLAQQSPQAAPTPPTRLGKIRPQTSWLRTMTLTTRNSSIPYRRLFVIILGGYTGSGLNRAIFVP